MVLSSTARITTSSMGIRRKAVTVGVDVRVRVRGDRHMHVHFQIGVIKIMCLIYARD